MKKSKKLIMNKNNRLFLTLSLLIILTFVLFLYLININLGLISAQDSQNSQDSQDSSTASPPSPPLPPSTTSTSPTTPTSESSTDPSTEKNTKSPSSNPTSNIVNKKDIDPNTGLPLEVQKINNIAKDIQNKNQSYLKQEWIKILTKNKAFATLDKFFTKISIVFKILFGMEYKTLSGTLLLIIILWMIIFLKISSIFNAMFNFANFSGYIIGMVFAVILAQLELFKSLAIFMINILTGQQSPWAKLILSLIIIIVLVLMYSLGNYFTNLLKKQKEEKKEKEYNLAREKTIAREKGRQEITKILQE